MRFSTGGDTHRRSQAIAVGFRANQLDAQALVRRRSALRIISEQVYRTAVRGKEQVQAAVIIEISVGGASPNTRGCERQTERLGDFLEFSFTVIPEEMRRHGVFYVGLHALNVRINMAVGDENIRPTVEIVVEEKAAESQREERRASDIRARSFIDEQSLSLIMIERNHLV